MAAQNLKSGNCYLCGKTVNKTAIKNHIIKEHGNIGEESVLLKIEGEYNKDYWIYIDIPKTKSLACLDSFLRDIWVECCGHLSQFYRGRRDPVSSRHKIGEFEQDGQLMYHYDMGSTTRLLITFICDIKRPAGYKDIRLIARNILPAQTCTVCGQAEAGYYCPECEWEENDTFLCPKCAKKHKHKNRCEPMINSPRAGVCGYSGNSSYDFTGDFERDIKTSDIGGGTADSEYEIPEESGNSEVFDISGKDIWENQKDNDSKVSFEFGFGDMFDPFDDELEEYNRERKLWSWAPPKFSLAEIFGAMTITKSLHLAKSKGIFITSKNRTKEDVSEKLIGFFSEAGFVGDILLLLDDGQFDFFKKVAEHKQYVYNPKTDDYIFDIDMAGMIENYILAQFNDFHNLYFVVPEEIREVYKNISVPEFFEKRQLYSLIRRYADAAVNLYGVMDMENFRAVFNNYTGNKIESERLRELLKQLCGFRSEFGFGFLNGCLIHRTIEREDNSAEILACLIDEKKDKPYYQPESGEAFLKYENDEYYERTDAVAKFEDYLKANGISGEEKLEEILSAICWLAKSGEIVRQRLGFLKVLRNGTDFRVKSLKMADKIASLIKELYDSSRSWLKNGYTLKDGVDGKSAAVRLNEALEKSQKQSIINGTDDMTMEEIDEIIAEARREKRGDL